MEPPVSPATFVTRSPEETADAGRLIGSLARADDVIALAGDLGAGKTCLTQGIARGMGIVEHVPSPTFNILLVHPGERTLYHVDLYRLERPDQLEDIDLYATAESGGVTVIEWADRFPDEMPPQRLDVTLTACGPEERTITLVPRGARATELADAFSRHWGERP